MLPQITRKLLILFVGLLFSNGLFNYSIAQHCEPNLKWLNHLNSLSLNQEVLALGQCASKSAASDTFKWVMADWLRQHGERKAAEEWLKEIHQPGLIRAKGLSLVRLNAVEKVEVWPLFERYSAKLNQADTQFVGVSLDYQEIIEQLNKRIKPQRSMDSMLRKLREDESSWARQMIETNNSLMRLHFPSMGKATVLSIVPGLGKWYVGRKGEALASLLVISLFTATTIELSHQMGFTHISTLTAGLGGLVFYWGGILGTRRSVRSVWNRNKTTYEEAINRLMDARLSALLQPNSSSGN